MPISGWPPLTLQFTDTSNADATAWHWQFGDGTSSTIQNPVHTYTSSGEYTVLLTVTTPAGIAQHSDTVNVLSLLTGSLLTNLYAYWALDEVSGTRYKTLGSAISADLTEIYVPVPSDTGRFALAAKCIPAGWYNSPVLSTVVDPTLNAATTPLTFAFWFMFDSSLPPLPKVNICPIRMESSVAIPPGSTGTVFYPRLAFNYGPAPQTPSIYSWVVLTDGSFSSTGLIATPTAEEWHLMFTWTDPSGLCSFQVDDGPITTMTVDPAKLGIQDQLDIFNLGAIDGTWDYWYGKVDAPMIWTRNLSAAERTALWISDPTVTSWTPSAPSDGSPGYDPKVILRMSNDGGKTWLPEAMRSAGKRGEYRKRVIWNRLGCARRRVFEVSVSDPIPWRLTGAYMDATSTERR
jgi:PKD repeat protein